MKIKKQNDRITEQKEQIEAQNINLRIENEGHLAAESENLFKESSLIPAIKNVGLTKLSLNPELKLGYLLPARSRA